MSQSDIIDPEALDRLREWGGDKLLNQMVQLFLENSVARMDQICSGVSEGDLGKAEAGAHSLKSSAANVGAGQVRALSMEMEDRSSAGDGEALKSLLPQLEEAYDQATAALGSIISGDTE